MKGKILVIVMRLEAVSCGMNNLMTMLLEEILHLEQLLAISLFLRLEQSKNTTMKGLGEGRISTRVHVHVEDWERNDAETASMVDLSLLKQLTSTTTKKEAVESMKVMMKRRLVLTLYQFTKVNVLDTGTVLWICRPSCLDRFCLKFKCYSC